MRKFRNDLLARNIHRILDLCGAVVMILAAIVALGVVLHYCGVQS